MSPADELARELEALERRLREPAVRREPAEVLALLAAGFRGVGSSGRVWGRAEIAAALAGEGDGSAVTLGPGPALVTYLSEQAGRRSLRSSVWVREGESWRMLFHQGTPVRL